MIHATRTITVGEKESIIDKPIVLYRGDREVEIEFTLVGNEFMFSPDGNVIKSTNASHGQLVLNTPSGENMFSVLSECHEGKVIFVVTKEMIDELIETGFYSFQIRLYDGEEMRSRVTIPPVTIGFDIRNPIAAEDETNVVDVGLVEYSRITKEQTDDELPTFDWKGNYNKTEWEHHDLIAVNKMNKIEDALYTISEGLNDSDNRFLQKANNMEKEFQNKVNELKASDKELGYEIGEVNRTINNRIDKLEVDVNVGDVAWKNEVEERITSVNVDSFGAIGDGVNDDTKAISDCIDYVTNILKNSKKIVFSPGKTYMVDEIYPKSGNTIDFTGSVIKKIPTDNDVYGVLTIHKQKNINIINPKIIGDKENHLGTYGESGHGIRIGGCENVFIHNANISNCWGDGIYIGLVGDTFNNNINLLGEIKVNNCRRQGVSVIYCTNSFIDTIIAEDIRGTDPQCALDIEPNRSFESVSNLHIKHVIGRNCAKGVNIILNTPDMDITIDKISLENCEGSIYIANNPEENKSGESETISSAEKSITIGEIYLSKCVDRPIVRVRNHTVNYPKISINKIMCDRYEIIDTDVPTTEQCLVLMESTTYSLLDCSTYGNVTIDEISVNNLKTEIATLVIKNNLTTSSLDYPISIENVYINKIHVNDMTKIRRPLTQAAAHNNFYIDHPNKFSVYGANSSSLMNGFNVILSEHYEGTNIDIRANLCQCVLYTNKLSFSFNFIEGTKNNNVYLDGVLQDVTKGGLNISQSQDKLFQISKTGNNIYITTMFGTVPKCNKVVSTNSRPTGVGIGAQVFDGQINKPIWYTGSGKWVDANGTIV